MNTEKTKMYIVLFVGVIAMIGIFTLIFSAYSDVVGAAVSLHPDLRGDTDNDGLTNRKELSIGTDPSNPDTDGDGLSDGNEVNIYGIDPTKSDTDGDGIVDSLDLGLCYDTDGGITYDVTGTVTAPTWYSTGNAWDSGTDECDNDGKLERILKKSLFEF